MIHILSKSFAFNSAVTQALARNLHSDRHKKMMFMSQMCQMHKNYLIIKVSFLGM